MSYKWWRTQTCSGAHWQWRTVTAGVVPWWWWTVNAGGTPLDSSDCALAIQLLTLPLCLSCQLYHPLTPLTPPILLMSPPTVSLTLLLLLPSTYTISVIGYSFISCWADWRYLKLPQVNSEFSMHKSCHITNGTVPSSLEPLACFLVFIAILLTSPSYCWLTPPTL